MTGVLIGAVVLALAVTSVNLLLLLGVVRRLREYDSRLARLGPLGADVPPPTSLTVGDQVPDFSAVSVDGRALRRSDLPEPVLVGFFSPQCDVCHERLPAFQAIASAVGTAVAVVVRDGGDAEALVAEVKGDGIDVVVEDLDGPLSGPFGVRGFPTFVTLDRSGLVRSVGFEVPVVEPA